MAVRLRVTSLIDLGGWAEHYASRPLGHYKSEVYELFIDILGGLASETRKCSFLDVGAGPGHLTCAYFKRFPKSTARWTLIDGSSELLRIARERMQERPRQVRTIVRGMNAPHWAKGLGHFDAILSNNAMFSIRKKLLGEFYRTCYRMLGTNGLMLNQQTFSWQGAQNPYGTAPFSTYMKRLPKRIMPHLEGLTPALEAKFERENRAAQERHQQAIQEAKARGDVLPPETQHGYVWLTVEHHLALMRRAGFVAGCIWRKREFAVVLGVKGNPLH